MTQSQELQELCDLTVSNILKILYGWWVSTRDMGVFVRKMREMADDLDGTRNHADRRSAYVTEVQHD